MMLLFSSVGGSASPSVLIIIPSSLSALQTLWSLLGNCLLFLGCISGLVWSWHWFLINNTFKTRVLKSNPCVWDNPYDNPHEVWDYNEEIPLCWWTKTILKSCSSVIFIFGLTAIWLWKQRCLCQSYDCSSSVKSKTEAFFLQSCYVIGWETLSIFTPSHFLQLSALQTIKIMTICTDTQ